MTRRSIAFVLVAMMLSALAAAEPYAPVVTMVVTMPDGRTQELTAAESGLATLTLKEWVVQGDGQRNRRLPSCSFGEVNAVNEKRAKVPENVPYRLCPKPGALAEANHSRGCS